MRPTTSLAQYLVAVRLDRLPSTVVTKARLVLLDTIGAVLGGAETEELRALATTFDASGPATLLGGGRGASIRDAALWNGTAGSVLEMYEGSRFTRGPTAIQLVPAALAEAERAGAGGRSLITAVVTGYEVASRMARAGHLKDLHHPCGTWGVMGAAVAVAALRELDTPAMEAAIHLAGTLCLTTSLDTVREGATVRNAYAGIANCLGLLAVDLVQAGFTPLGDGAARAYGGLLCDGFDDRVLTKELGTSFEIEKGYFKRHACYRHGHAALDALALIVDREGLQPDAIRGIRVQTYDFAARLTNPAPETTLAAQFSIPHALAAFCVLRHAGPAAFRGAALTDSRIADLRRRIIVLERPDYTAMQPVRRPATVEVETTDGRAFSETVELARGEPENPLTVEEIEAKFLDLARKPLGEVDSLRLIDELRHLETVTDIRPVLARARGS